MNFKELMEFDKQIVEKYMDELLSINVIYEKKLIESMKYSVQAGGKRLRPILFLETIKLLNKERGFKLESLTFSLEGVDGATISLDETSLIFLVVSRLTVFAFLVEFSTMYLILFVSYVCLPRGFLRALVLLIGLD